jgi:uncharacterized circularly permuted ATP-grasp superfamily protein/uncharacterized alpha-E superfamily protein
MSPWDEMTDRNGTIRPAWSILAASLARWTPDDRAGLVASAERLLEDLGATYNVYTDAGGAGRPFRADPLPLPIEFTEWQRVAAGLEQRGRLLEAVLADVYGPQRLLKEGLLSPDLVHANPDFLPNVRGIQPPGGKYLLATGFDLIRDPWGSWAVLRDHARVPGGLSQTLESRSVSANMLPEEFEASRVAKIAPFSSLERDVLHDLTPMRHEPPLVVLLTPGFRHPSYFEHAFKARALGIPLVEPGDLTVRERRLYLKTLSGLRRVDVVACRLDDNGIDPLELWNGGGAGVPGLIEAWRSGNVALANAPGSAFAGSRALMPFLPGICRALFGEDLKLPFVETWWLGQAGVCDRVLRDFGNFVLFPAFGEHAELPVRVSSLSADSRAAWEARVIARPHAFVAQRDLSPGTAPVLEGRSLKSRPVCWRSFCLHASQGPQTLKGGIALHAKDGLASTGWNRGDLIAKDVWITHETSGETVARSPENAPFAAKREISGTDVPSRIAEQLFWVGRYAERLEGVTRLLRTTIHRITGEATPARDPQLALCLRLLEGLGVLPPGIPHSALLHALAGLIGRNATGLSGLHTEVRALMWNAASARDRLSDDTWRLFNRLESLFNGEASSPNAATLIQKLDSVVLHLAAFAGMQAENMTRGQGWRFLELGRRIERAIGVLNLLEYASHAPDRDLTAPEPLLETCDSAMTYRRRHLSRPRWQPVVDLLLSDPTNPRAVAYQLKVLVQEAPFLPGLPEQGLLPRIRQSIAELQDSLSQPQMAGDWRQRSQDLTRLSDLLTQHYFSHSVRHVY